MQDGMGGTVFLPVVDVERGISFALPATLLSKQLRLEPFLLECIEQRRLLKLGQKLESGTLVVNGFDQHDME